MIITSGPYLSPHFANTVIRNCWPVVDAGGSAESGMGDDVAFVDAALAAEQIRSRPDMRVLTSGEHALGWVSRHLAGTQAERAARLFKDKAAFRRLLRPLFPEFSFCELSIDELRSHEPCEMDYPFVLKPAVGFFSIGVHTVRTPDEWKNARRQIEEDVNGAKKYFPEHMLSQVRFLIEAYIEGDEYAVDAYYDAEGNPVVLNVMQHRYAGSDDVSDRLYVSSKQIIQSQAPDAGDFLVGINRHAGIRNFPLHAEFRRDAGGNLVPIEVNPFRFGGWCTTGDFSHFAWGFNSYELYMSDSAPDWDRVFDGREENEYGLVVLDNRTGVPGTEIRSFDYEGLLRNFSKPLHLAPMDFRAFPLFGFLFMETAPSFQAEQDWILGSDLGEFVSSGSV